MPKGKDLGIVRGGRSAQQERPIEPDLDAWKRHGSKWETPVSDPILDPAEIAEKFPTLGLSIGDALP